MDKRSKIAIIGFGVEGKAVYEYLLKHKYTQLTVCDQNVDLDFKFDEGVSSELGEHYLNDLDQFEFVFRGPGIPYLRPEIQAAKAAGTKITSCTKFFLDQCPCDVIGVSGTKGKGTCATLIYEIFKESGEKPGVNLFLGGNIGKAPIEFLDKLKGNHLVVLELSSFQLQDLENSPKYAVLLNTNEDHLDYHADKDEYMHAKENLISHQGKDDLVVMNADYEYLKFYKNLVKGDLKLISVDKEIEGSAYVKDDAIYYDGEEILKVEDVELVGSHNLENILPAIVIAKAFDISDKKIASVVKKFKNLPYRLQLTRELKGVRYFNDSYSTTPETSMAAVNSFDEATVLIAGGYDKGADYNEWALKILTKPNLHTVILIGANAEKMEQALFDAEEKLGEAEGSPTKILRRNRMEDAVIDAYAEADEGGVVVMSPAAASFDMYENYKARGNDFTAQVRKLK